MLDRRGEGHDVESLVFPARQEPHPLQLESRYAVQVAIAIAARGARAFSVAAPIGLGELRFRNGSGRFFGNEIAVCDFCVGPLGAPSRPSLHGLLQERGKIDEIQRQRALLFAPERVIHLAHVGMRFRRFKGARQITSVSVGEEHFHPYTDHSAAVRLYFDAGLRRWLQYRYLISAVCGKEP